MIGLKSDYGSLAAKLAFKDDYSAILEQELVFLKQTKSDGKNDTRIK